MTYIKRLLTQAIQQHLSRGKSILLLGPRQTGKTTLLNHQITADLSYSFLEATLRRAFERNPDDLIKEIKGHLALYPQKQKILVLIDEVQKVPEIMDAVQYAIDNKLAQFILTGSSARKLKHNHHELNWLPGRVIFLRMDSLSLIEMEPFSLNLDDLLLNGCLPEIFLEIDPQAKDALLMSYVSTYLEEEVRAEALVRNLGSFSQFLRLASIEAGKPINISKLAQAIGVTRHLLQEYYQILQDCLLLDRIEPLTQVSSRRRLSKAPKYLLFDLGVRRIAAGEGLALPESYYGELFEQFIGVEILKIIRAFAPQARLYYWKDHNGPEVDYVIEYNRQYLPIEVKYTQSPSFNDARHLATFSEEYPCLHPALIVCRTENPKQISENVIAIHWQTIPAMLQQLLQLPSMGNKK